MQNDEMTPNKNTEDTLPLEETEALPTEMSKEDYEMSLEAILFAAGHPMTYEQLAKTYEIPVSEMRDIVNAYAKKYNTSKLSRGVTLITFDSCCQLCTKPEYISLIRRALGIRKNTGTLSASTIEALTIVAYQQPVTRAYVDAVRNADSSYAMTNLLDRGLIEPKGRKDAPGRPVLFGTTSAFLRCFGLSSLDDLPGSEGDALGVFRSINSHLHIDDGSEQITIDELMNGEAPSEESGVEDRIAAPAEDTEDGMSATEEAERETE